MSADYEARERRFLELLAAATNETGIEISGCGCCGSPSLGDVKDWSGPMFSKGHYEQDPRDGQVSFRKAGT